MVHEISIVDRRIKNGYEKSRLPVRNALADDRIEEGPEAKNVLVTIVVPSPWIC